MKSKARFLDLDVHAETIAVAIAEADSEVRSLATIPNRAEPIRRLIRELGSPDLLRAAMKLAAQGTCFIRSRVSLRWSVRIQLLHRLRSVVGTVTEGSIFLQVEGEPPVALKGGDSFFEPAGRRLCI